MLTPFDVETQKETGLDNLQLNVLMLIGAKVEYEDQIAAILGISQKDVQDVIEELIILGKVDSKTLPDKPTVN